MKQKRFSMMLVAVLSLALTVSGMALAQDDDTPEQPTRPTLELPEACVGDYQAAVAQWDGTTWPIRIDPSTMSEECQQALQEARQNLGPNNRPGFGQQGQPPQGRPGFGQQGQVPQGRPGFGQQGQVPQGRPGFGQQGAGLELPEACQADFQAAVAQWDGTTWPIRIDPSTMSEECQQTLSTLHPNFPGGAAPIAPPSDASGQ